MKKKFDFELKDLEGKPFNAWQSEAFAQWLAENGEPQAAKKLREGFPVKPLMAYTAVISAITNPVEGEKIDGNEMVKRYKLATELYGGKEVDLKSEDLTLIKSQLPKHFGVMVSAPIIMYLDADAIVSPEIKTTPALNKET